MQCTTTLQWNNQHAAPDATCLVCRKMPNVHTTPTDPTPHTGHNHTSYKPYQPESNACRQGQAGLWDSVSYLLNTQQGKPRTPPRPPQKPWTAASTGREREPKTAKLSEVSKETAAELQQLHLCGQAAGGMRQHLTRERADRRRGVCMYECTLHPSQQLPYTHV